MIVEVSDYTKLERNQQADYCVVGAREGTDPGEKIVQCKMMTFHHCCICKRSMCEDHAVRDVNRRTIDICTRCAADAVIILTTAGKDSRTLRITRDGLRELARIPTFVGPPQALTWEQLGRFERDLFNDPTMLGKWKPRCKSAHIIKDAMGYGKDGTISCSLEQGHVIQGKPSHRSEGAREWLDV